MNYGVIVSQDSFVFTKCGVMSVGYFRKNSEVLGVEGIGKRTKFKKVTVHLKNKPTLGIRLITQATDSILVPKSIVFSEKAVQAEKLCSATEVEFYNPSEPPDFSVDSIANIGELHPNTAYAAGLLSNIISSSPNRLAFLIRNGTDPKYIKHVERNIANLVDIVDGKIKARINTGKLGHVWIIFKGDTAAKINRILRHFIPDHVCMNLNSRSLREFVAGMLDAYVDEPLYGGEPVLKFSIKNSVQKRFIQNALILYNSRLLETSCITTHAPKFLESTATVGRGIPIRNPTWDDLTQVPEGPRLFSRVRSWAETQTCSANLCFDEAGFSPIIDGLYSYPCLLSS